MDFIRAFTTLVLGCSGLVAEVADFHFLQATVKMAEGKLWQNKDVLAHCSENNLDIETVEEMKIPEGVTALLYNCFRCMFKPHGVDVDRFALRYTQKKITTLRRVILPKSLKEIDEAVFMGIGVEDIIFSPSLVYIGNEAFRNSSLTTVDLSMTQVRTVHWLTFADCMYLCSITLPDTLQELDNTAFNNCRELKRVSLPVCINFKTVADWCSSPRLFEKCHPSLTVIIRLQ